MQFVKLTERNTHEGETWRHWLQVDGNERELAKLRSLLADAKRTAPAGIAYSLADETVVESTVDALVAEQDDEGYMPAHTKVTGRFTCPDDLGDHADALYKGRIVEHFKAGDR